MTNKEENVDRAESYTKSLKEKEEKQQERFEEKYGRQIWDSTKQGTLRKKKD